MVRPAEVQSSNSDNRTPDRQVASASSLHCPHFQASESKEPEPMSENDFAIIREALDPDKVQRIRTPKDDVWDALTAHFGEPRTKTERSMFGRVVAELLEAGATEAETRKACEYVLATFDSPSVNAVPKWFSVAQNGVQRKSAQQIEIDRLRQL